MTFTQFNRWVQKRKMATNEQKQVAIFYIEDVDRIRGKTIMMEEQRRNKRQENYTVPAGVRVGHVHLKVTDLDQALDFTGIYSDFK